MRFFSDGPNIPDSLLLARDEGRVVFFCGAGVSRAKAGLPDFLGLTKQVIDKLGVAEEDKYKKEIEKIDSIGAGIMPIDEIFSLLDEFSDYNIQREVAQALKPSEEDGCLSAHKTLLDLATTPSGKVRLVTTNFDRLFDNCECKLDNFYPPKLADNDFDGIVYLHGRANEDYTGAEEEGFILSSSDFGRAYLDEAWATSFIKNLIENYVIVFVGYTADDVPVRYLLKAIKKKTKKSESIFAFQAVDDDKINDPWKSKGVKAIPYSLENDHDNQKKSHDALWRSLEAWAERARDTKAWVSKIIEMSRKGPSALEPYERSQVAHVVSTYEGAKRFYTNENPPPAEWLCVFDARQRYKQPGCPDRSFNENYVDPFDLYGLDSDSPPQKNDQGGERKIPDTAWDAFKLNDSDRKSIKDENLATLGNRVNIPDIVPRIQVLEKWIVKICAQPLTVWWAATRQKPLHREIQQQILFELQNNDKIPPHISQYWHQLFQVWDYIRARFFNDLFANKPTSDLFTLREVIKQQGWNDKIVQLLGVIFQPHLEVKADRWGDIKSTAAENNGSLMTFRPSYPDFCLFPNFSAIEVPDEWRAAFIKVLRKNLELAYTFLKEFHEYGFYRIPSITEDGNFYDYDRETLNGLSHLVILFSQQFFQLIRIDEKAAQQEFLAWPVKDDWIFARLRIWAAGKSEVVPDTEFKHVIANLSDTAFWNPCHRKNLLLTLAARWSKMSGEVRNSIEQRFIQGRNRSPDENEENFKKSRAKTSLSCLYWLINQGYEISQNTREALRKLWDTVPDWRIECAKTAADEPIKNYGGSVSINTDYEPLLNIPLSDVLKKAEELSGYSVDLSVENRPFKGLVENCPVRAFSALSYQAKRDHFPEWAWHEFFNSRLWYKTENSKVKDITPRFVGLISERLAGYPDEQLSKIMYLVTSWFYKISEHIDIKHIDTFDRIIKKFIDILQKHTDDSKASMIHRSNETDWMTEAWASPVGNVTCAMFNDPRIKNLLAGQGFPKIWLDRIETLLSLSGDLRRYVLVNLFQKLSWFYEKDFSWTETHLLSVLEAGDTFDQEFDQEAAWAGFLMGRKLPSREIYERLKDKILNFAKTKQSSDRYHNENVAMIILEGWRNIDEQARERWISNGEMRDTILNSGKEFRTHILIFFLRWMNGNTENENLIKEFQQLLNVWSRKEDLKSSETTEIFCELAFCNIGQFPALIELNLPYLKKITRNSASLYPLLKEKYAIIDRYPRKIIELLKVLLPEDKSSWPYYVDIILQKIIEADSTLRMDKDLKELQRKLDAR